MWGGGGAWGLRGLLAPRLGVARVTGTGTLRWRSPRREGPGAGTGRGRSGAVDRTRARGASLGVLSLCAPSSALGRPVGSTPGQSARRQADWTPHVGAMVSRTATCDEPTPRGPPCPRPMQGSGAAAPRARPGDPRGVQAEARGLGAKPPDPPAGEHAAGSAPAPHGQVTGPDWRPQRTRSSPEGNCQEQGRAGPARGPRSAEGPGRPGRALTDRQPRVRAHGRGDSPRAGCACRPRSRTPPPAGGTRAASRGVGRAPAGLVQQRGQRAPHRAPLPAGGQRDAGAHRPDSRPANVADAAQGRQGKGRCVSSQQGARPSPSPAAQRSRNPGACREENAQSVGPPSPAVTRRGPSGQTGAERPDGGRGSMLLRRRFTPRAICGFCVLQPKSQLAVSHFFFFWKKLLNRF